MGRDLKKSKRSKKEKEADLESKDTYLQHHVKRGVLIVVLLSITIGSFLSLLDLADVFGQQVKSVYYLLFGWGAWLFPLVVLAAALLFLDDSHQEESETLSVDRVLRLASLLLLVLSYSGLFNLFLANPEQMLLLSKSGSGGGYFGLVLGYPLILYTGFWFSFVVLIALILISFLLVFQTSLEKVLNPVHWWRQFRAWVRPPAPPADDQAVNQKQPLAVVSSAPKVKPKKNVKIPFRSKRDLPEEDKSLITAGIKTVVLEEAEPLTSQFEVSLLLPGKNKAKAGDIEGNQKIIYDTLSSFGINIEMSDVSVGPSVTQYAFKPAQGVKLSQITSLQNDLALALAAHPLRVEAPIPGKSLVGVEIPNRVVSIVSLRDVLVAPNFSAKGGMLKVGLGQDVGGNIMSTDLVKAPHMLISGATGSGKSSCVNSFIISLLYQHTPETLRLILVDPKRVELKVYEGIPHLLTPVITDVKKTVNALKWAVSEMDRRYQLLSEVGKRDIVSYNKKTTEKLPYIVFVIDELADLMAQSAKDVEAMIIRLAQMSRAVGIHLVLATQRPSVDVITGLIKANIPTRIAFAVASQTDSRTILDSSGAEKLLGRGDMLFLSPDLGKPLRIQGAFISDDEVHRVVKDLKTDAETDYQEGVTSKQNVQVPGMSKQSAEGGDDEELLIAAQSEILAAGKASASFLQRRLRIGYARAARLLDQLEERGIIGPADGARAREILIEAPEVDTEAEQL